MLNCINNLLKCVFGNIHRFHMTSFEDWMQQQGLSESSVNKCGNAISGPLTAWANTNSVVAGSLSDIEDLSKFKPISSAIQKLPTADMTGPEGKTAARVSPAAKTEKTPKAPTKMEIASSIYLRMSVQKDVTRKQIVEQLVAEAKLSAAGASTYYQLIKAKLG